MDESVFSLAEFEQRLEGARALMTDYKIDAMVVSSQKNVEYFSGFKSDLWASPTRPFFVLLSRSGPPVAVIPQGGDVPWLATSWIKEITTWPAPRPADEGVSEVAGLLKSRAEKFHRIGLEMGPESRIGMTLADALQLIDALRPVEVADCSELCRELRIIKSETEVSYIRKACGIASDAFDELPGRIICGMTDKQVVSLFSASMIASGADKVPFIAMGSGPNGYNSIIGRATGRELLEGDIFAIDTGAEVNGYFCDFDRNISIGAPCEQARQAYDALNRATDAGLSAARPGNRASDLYYSQLKAIEQAGFVPATMGRYGHGLGLALTEWPSNKPDDHTILRPGMVMTIEPGVDFGEGKVMVTEENLVITEDGHELLSRRAASEMPVVRF